jgi:hypothetical protein
MWDAKKDVFFTRYNGRLCSARRIVFEDRRDGPTAGRSR